MASTRDIKRKIKSVHSMSQITRAMNLVSAAKLQRAKSVLGEVRPFAEITRKTIASILHASKGIHHKFLNEREVKKTLIIAIASDRGLCGGFNSNISKETLQLMESKDNVECITVGNKIRDYLVRRNKTVGEHFAHVSENPDFGFSSKISRTAVSKFLSGEVDEVYIAYTSFKSTIAYEPTIIRVLPANADEFVHTSDGKTAKMNFEPDESQVLDVVIPKYVNVAIYGALVESSASQQGARMTAMDSATENAGEMIDKYTLQYNRARQNTITQEITEIVAGANAL